MDAKTSTASQDDENRLMREITQLKEELAANQRILDESKSSSGRNDDQVVEASLYEKLTKLVIAISSLSGGVAVASFARIDLVELALANEVGASAVAIFVAVLFLYYVFAPRVKKADSSFLNIDREALSAQMNRRLKDFYFVDGDVIGSNQHRTELRERTVTEPAEPADHNHQSPFASYVETVISSLDDRINLSEKKASMLLDRGTGYLRGGIYFYVATIFLWQVAIYYTGFHAHVWIGIFSCSLTFLVVEFLAAWFLKQYRSYVDSSIAYLRVRSTFNRYLLSYHAINEFAGESSADDLARLQILKVLEEEVKWPEMKDVNSNDFNFMLESMSTFTSALEKLRGAFDKDKGRTSI